MSDPKCPWCGERHPTEMIQMGEIEVTTCPRLGAHEAVMFALSPTPDLVGADPPSLAELEALAIAFEFPDPVAAVRLEDGSQVVAFQPAGLEVSAFGVDDLDERGMPRWKP